MAKRALRALVVLRLPLELKQQLDALRARGYTINGYVVHLIERELAHPQQPAAKTARKAR
ncbi:MAG: hypothetical protein OJF50_003857 [Nitrospira sp.]|jgi:predicted DNA-binding protein|nr:hypothetical protein [Nitrospira sp.]